MKNVAGRKAEDDVTNAKIEALLKGCEQIKAVSSDPVNGEVGNKAGKEEASTEMQDLNDCEETKSAYNGTAKKKSLFLKISKISLGKTQVPNQMTKRKTRLLSKKQRKLAILPEKKEQAAADKSKTNERNLIPNGRRSPTATTNRPRFC